MSPAALASPFPVRPSSSRLPAPLFVSGDVEPTGLFACLDGVMPTAGGGRGHALYVCSGGGVNRHASIVPSALLLRIGWRRERERFRCDTTGTAACPVMGWQRDGVVRVPWMCGGGWCVVRCLLDMRRAGDEMMRCSYPRAFSLSFSFRPAPSPRLFPICLLQFVPPPSGSGEAWADVDLRLLVEGRSACLSSWPYRSLAIARSLFLGGLRLVPSSSCGRMLRFLRDFIIVSVVVSSRIRYRMIRCG